LALKRGIRKRHQEAHDIFVLATAAAGNWENRRMPRITDEKILFQLSEAMS
jgi:hypothetical protein